MAVHVGSTPPRLSKPWQSQCLRNFLLPPTDNGLALIRAGPLSLSTILSWGCFRILHQLVLLVSFSGDLIWARGCGLWTLPRLWKTREARAARVAFGLGEDYELVTNAAAAFSTIAWKTLRVSHERPQAPPDIYTRKSHSFEHKERASIYWRLWKTPPPRLRRELSSCEQGLEPSGRWGRFPQPRTLPLRAVRVCS